MKLVKLFVVVLVGSAVGLGRADYSQREEVTVPAVLKVCLGCTYGSIQAAVEAAKPGDVIEVYPPYLNSTLHLLGRKSNNFQASYPRGQTC